MIPVFQVYFCLMQSLCVGLWVLPGKQGGMFDGLHYALASVNILLSGTAALLKNRDSAAVIAIAIKAGVFCRFF